MSWRRKELMIKGEISEWVYVKNLAELDCWWYRLLSDERFLKKWKEWYISHLHHHNHHHYTSPHLHLIFIFNGDMVWVIQQDPASCKAASSSHVCFDVVFYGRLPFLMPPLFAVCTECLICVTSTCKVTG